VSFELKPVGSLCVLYVMAVRAEYGPNLQGCISPLFTGVGPVEAALSLSAVLARLEANDRRPGLVVSLGSAGSRALVQTEIYQASSVSYRDMDASLLGFVKGQTPYLDLPAELELAPKIPGMKQARLSTGAAVISGQGYSSIDADMVDMETFALKRVCQHFDLPLIALRGISDGNEELSGHNSWTQYLHIIDEKLARIVGELETALRNSRLDF